MHRKKAYKDTQNCLATLLLESCMKGTLILTLYTSCVCTYFIHIYIYNFSNNHLLFLEENK